MSKRNDSIGLFKRVLIKCKATMYELICPSCKHVQASSFVRIGATVTYPSCKRQFRIENKYLHRIVANNDQNKHNLAMPQTLAQENAPVTDTAGVSQQATTEEAPSQPPSGPQPKPLHKSRIATTAIIIVDRIVMVISLGIQQHRRKATLQPTVANPLVGVSKRP